MPASSYLTSHKNRVAWVAQASTTASYHNVTHSKNRLPTPHNPPARSAPHPHTPNNRGFTPSLIALVPKSIRYLQYEARHESIPSPQCLHPAGDRPGDHDYRHGCPGCASAHHEAHRLADLRGGHDHRGESRQQHPRVD